MKLLSTEAEGVNVAIPEADRQIFVNSAGRVGALLGLKSTDPGNTSYHASQQLSVHAVYIHAFCAVYVHAFKLLQDEL